jgi:TRAP-type C4-dicarboxylate transport system permease small subunit
MHAAPAMTLPGQPSARLFALEKHVFAAEKAVCIAALAVMLFAITTSVFVRYLNLPLPNLSEWGVVAMAPLTFIGMAMCAHTGTHIAVDVVNALPNALLRRAFRFAVGTGSVVFATVYLYTGWIFLREAVASGEKMMDLGTPIALPLAFLPLGMALVLFHALLDMWRTVLDVAPPSPEESA